MVDENAMRKTVAKFRLTPNVATDRIRAIAQKSENVIFGDHAQERMFERGITDVQVMEILRRGIVSEAPEKTEYDEWKCKIVMHLRGKREAGVIVVILRDNRLFLKTVEWEDFK